MYSFTCWSVAGRPGTSDLLLEARVRSCTHTPRPKGRIKPARRFGRTTAGLRPPCVRPNRPTYVSLTGQGCCRARDVVPPGATAIHADADRLVLQHPREGRAGELAALVGVEDLRFAVTRQGLLHRVKAELGLHRDRQPPSQHPSAEPIQHS